MRSLKIVSLPSTYTLCILSEWPHNSPWLGTHLVRVDIVNVGLAAISEMMPMKIQYLHQSDVSNQVMWQIFTNQTPVLLLLTNQRPVFRSRDLYWPMRGPYCYYWPIRGQYYLSQPFQFPFPPSHVCRVPARVCLFPSNVSYSGHLNTRCRHSWIILDKIIPDVVSEIGIAVIVTSSRIIPWHWNIF